MASKIAVAMVHGVTIDDPHFASGAARRLKRRFAHYAGLKVDDPDDIVVIQPVHWAPVLEPLEKRLLARTLGSDHGRFHEALRAMVIKVNAGATGALLSLLLALLSRSYPSGFRLKYPTLRWLMVNFIGDAIAYQITATDREIYDRINEVFAESLRTLANRAGADAPLCVIAHSLGTVVASNCLYDLEKERRRETSVLSSSARKRLQDASPLERGETLRLLYTLGSPIALWTLSYEQFGKPITVPEWVNFYDQDDVIAYPLKNLSRRYDRAVTEDCSVNVGGFWASWNPLAHVGYWNSDVVMDRIAQSLVREWKQVNDSGAAPRPRRPARIARLSRGRVVAAL